VQAGGGEAGVKAMEPQNCVGGTLGCYGRKMKK
jgi:hypothetical protein